MSRPQPGIITPSIRQDSWLTAGRPGGTSELPSQGYRDNATSQTVRSGSWPTTLAWEKSIIREPFPAWQGGPHFHPRIHPVFHTSKMRLGGLILALGVFGLVEGAAVGCKNPPQRKEWRELDLTQRQEYIDAVHCLASLDAISGFEGTVNRFDDFQATHSDQTPTIHWVGHFVLWHRYFLATYEKALREECGYKGAQPYWNWSLDASSTDNSSTAIFESELFDPEVGFGGNGGYLDITPEQNPLNLTGRTGGDCVKDGPFTSEYFMVNYPEPDCLRRDFIPWVMNYFARQSLVDHVQSQPDYTSFARALENIPQFTQPNIHGSGHFGVGGVLGQLGNQAQSPGDPLFYLHHGNIDRVFWEWQTKDLSQRLHQVGGPVEPMDYSGTNVTLDFKINIGNLAGDARLEDLLNIHGNVLCYDY